MTSKAEQHVPPPPAPWRPLFEKHVAKLSPSHFSFATVHQDASTGRVSPRVRTCIFRNFWTEIDAHPSAVESMKSTKHPAADFKTTAQLSQDSSAESNLEEGVNKKAFASDLFTFTTDVRMAKVEDLTGPDGKPGVDVEAGFWIEAVSTQWRIQGKAYVIGGNPDDETEKQAREEIGKRMRQREGASSEIIRNWNWEKEITAQFANLSPLMRGRCLSG